MNRATLQWLDKDGNPVTTNGGISVSDQSVQLSVISQTLTFSSLRLSHAGQYSCQASLSSVALPSPLVDTAMTEVTLQSKCASICIL